MPKIVTSISIRKKLKELDLKYDFSNFVYHGNRNDKSIVICPEHGEFETSYHSILKSKKNLICKKCRNEYQQKILFRKKHGDIGLREFLINIINEREYCQNVDVSKIGENIYFTISSNNSQVNLHCKKHGDFLISVSSLMSYKESGCPDCKKDEGLHGKRTYDDNLYLPYNFAKIFVHSLKLITRDEYYEWWENNRPYFLPRQPDKYYNENK